MAKPTRRITIKNCIHDRVYVGSAIWIERLYFKMGFKRDG